jgi:hypothetical protein
MPGCSYPICLPVANSFYPCAGAPANVAAAEQLALSRVRYGSPAQWSAHNFAALHGELVKLVDGGPSGARMADRFAQNVPSTAGVGPDKMVRQYPLDLLLLASLHPAVAQMLGLYWADTQAVSGVAYDYLVVSALNTSLGTSASAALQWLNQNGFNEVDAYIVFNVSIDQPSPPLRAPGGLKVYALPNVPIVPATGTAPANNNHAGLLWDLDAAPNGALMPGAPVMYHVWRAALGNGQSPTIPAATDYTPITAGGGVLVVNSKGPVSQATTPSWPPDRIYYTDRSLADGWYGYQVNGVDPFGRHSVNSAAGAWYQWAPAPSPKLWYFKDPPPADLVVHPSAVRLRDATAPPAPSAVEAFALDPLDPTVLKDAAYQKWKSALAAAAWYQALNPDERDRLIGLRVRWRWSADAMLQAPDTREFRIYLHDTPMNAVHGRVVSVTPASATESIVVTDIASAYPADAFKGLRLVVSNDAFVIAASQGAALTLRVKNIGARDDVHPHRVSAPLSSSHRIIRPCRTRILPAQPHGPSATTSCGMTMRRDGTRSPRPPDMPAASTKYSFQIQIPPPHMPACR